MLLLCASIVVSIVVSIVGIPHTRINPMNPILTTAQMAAFFAEREGGEINVLKLMKLLYLADRESMRRYGYPITMDVAHSLPHGPVLSKTLDLINGFAGEEENKIWEEWIGDRANHTVALLQKLPAKPSHLSPADEEILESVWAEFGAMNQWQLRDYTHDHCPEWSDPTASPTNSVRIKDVDVLRAVGHDERLVSIYAEELRAQRGVRQYFVEMDKADPVDAQ